ncbi:MAG: hypothetical protein AB7V50_00315 [Vampirovibrionia bacterium]
MKHKCVIDIGSNTIKLFIAELDDNDRINPVIVKRRMTGLGKYKNNSSELDEKAKETVIKNLVKYLKLSEKYKISPDNILITATAACRNASDGYDFIQNIQHNYNLKHIKVLTGQEEAKYTYLGVIESIKCNKSYNYSVLDIGGGSFQVSGGTETDYKFGISIQKGCNPTTELFKLNKRVDLKTIKETINYFKELSLDSIPSNYQPQKIIGVGGTLKIMQIMLDDINSSKTLNIEEINNLTEWLASRTIKQRYNWFKEKYEDKKFRKNAGLTIKRAEVILAGCCITIGLLNKLNAKEIIISNTDAKDYIIKLSNL